MRDDLDRVIEIGVLLSLVTLMLAFLSSCDEERITRVETTAVAMPIQCYSDAVGAPQRTLGGYVTSTLAPNLAAVEIRTFTDHGGTYVRSPDGRRCVLGTLDSEP